MEAFLLKHIAIIQLLRMDLAKEKLKTSLVQPKVFLILLQTGHLQLKTRYLELDQNKNNKMMEIVLSFKKINYIKSIKLKAQAILNTKVIARHCFRTRLLK